jgi:hypothetical protein
MGRVPHGRVRASWVCACLVGVYLMAGVPHGCVPHGCVPHGCVPYGACTTWVCTSCACISWACTPPGMYLIGVYLAGHVPPGRASYWACTSQDAHLRGMCLMGVICVEALGKSPYNPPYAGQDNQFVVRPPPERAWSFVRHPLISTH